LRRWGRDAAVVAAAGVGLGALSVGSDYFLHNPWALIGNVAGTWFAVAFAVGAFVGTESVRRGALGGLVALVIATLAYYVGTSLAWDIVEVDRLIPGALVWGAIALLAGPIAGAAGAVWRRRIFRGRADWWLAAVAVGMLSAVLMAEGLYLGFLFSGSDTAIGSFAELAIGLTFPIWLLRLVREWRVAYVVAALVGIILLVALAIGLRSVQTLAGSGHL
jgi:hypothetical protein